ncbi:UNVERIFIED_CONTAM: protein ALWAYS EARLY 3 [Sesamum radiatum]|uniref:Protein ALWAYS EARLY 3 n=1 Tax=Sesamum radiatum TaxID=300843 RepID=A0AAW2QIX2_SESRA
MGPTRKSRSLNKRHVSEVSPSKDGDGAKRSNVRNSRKFFSGTLQPDLWFLRFVPLYRKRKLSDMLGPRWTMEELARFYDAYRKYGKDWKKVAGAVRNRSAEMVEALYMMNRDLKNSEMDELGSLPLMHSSKQLYVLGQSQSITSIAISFLVLAYLSLPHGTASAAGLIAMMTDHYSNLAGTDSDQESNDGAGSSRKTQKRARGKLHPTTSKSTDEQLVSHSQTIASNYGCLSLLKKKRPGGSRPCPVGKRTPRFPVSFSYENINGEGYVSPTRQGMKLKASGNDDEIAHEIAIALAEASQRGGSPQVSRTPGRRAESVTSSPFRQAQRKHSLVEMPNSKILDADMDEEDLEGSTEGDTGELSGCKPSMKESISIGAVRKKVRKLEGKKFDVDNNNENHLDDIKEECSGTEEGQRFSATQGKLDAEVTNTQISRSSMQNQGKKSKKVLFRRGMRDFSIYPTIMFKSL